MIDLLQQLLDDFICFIETGIVLFANLVLEGLAALVSAIVSVLPDMPGAGSIPDWVTNGYHFVAYFFPVDFAMTLGLSYVTFYLAWILVAVALRWAKVVSGSA